MRRVTRLRWGLSVLLALGTCTLGLLPVDTATAQPSSPRPLSPGLVTAMQRDLGLTASQARTRGERETAAAELAPRAERAAGRTFGGSWYDPARGTLVVGVTDTGTAAIRVRSGRFGDFTAAVEADTELCEPVDACLIT
ncbi:S1 family peptidase, partial [Streptomyces mirabilis]